MPAVTLCRCSRGAMRCSHVNVLNIQHIVCIDSHCVSAIQARKLEGFLAWSYVVSGCNDTWACL
jgi:hypothetical protein